MVHQSFPPENLNMMPIPPSLLVGIAGVVLLMLVALPATKSLANRLRLQKKSSAGQLYQDEDGAATEESTKAFTDTIQRCSIAALSLGGLLASLSLAVLGTDGTRSPHQPGASEQWLHFAVWVSETSHISEP